MMMLLLFSFFLIIPALRAAATIIHQPISIIQFLPSANASRVSLEVIHAQLLQLNRAFSGEEARAAGYKKAMDSMIRFHLAGVRYVVNEEYFDLSLR